MQCVRLAWSQDILERGGDDEVVTQLALTASRGQWCRDQVVGLLKRFFSVPRGDIKNASAYLHRGVQFIEHDYARWSNQHSWSWVCFFSFAFFNLTAHVLDSACHLFVFRVAFHFDSACLWQRWSLLWLSFQQKSILFCRANSVGHVACLLSGALVSC